MLHPYDCFEYDDKDYDVNQTVFGRKSKTHVLLSESINVALFNYTRAFGDRPRNLDPWSRRGQHLGWQLSSPNYHTTPAGGRLSSRKIKRASLPYMA
ncbi:hypothetical protein TNCV_4693931 [Trichonephila clavipes]|uniref:Uncharacterized protein n=1 Tax=Trichonephila clavipes TaxID=2585209 RepID=A0A8X7BID4_TRICX|nr:hypothetical protein TNCV_4693931 [Trichonephila clavipes]